MSTGQGGHLRGQQTRDDKRTGSWPWSGEYNAIMCSRCDGQGRRSLCCRAILEKKLRGVTQLFCNEYEDFLASEVVTFERHAYCV